MQASRLILTGEAVAQIAGGRGVVEVSREGIERYVLVAVREGNSAASVALRPEERERMVEGC